MLRGWSSYRFVSTVRRQSEGSRFGFAVATRSPFHSIAVHQADTAPLRKQLKDAARSSKIQVKVSDNESDRKLADWKCTIGIEIHAQLNTSKKLFSCKTFLYVHFMHLTGL